MITGFLFNETGYALRGNAEALRMEERYPQVEHQQFNQESHTVSVQKQRAVDYTQFINTRK